MQLATFTIRRSLSGKTLKAWRKAHNLSAHALAVELGVSRQYIKSIEGGSLSASQKFTHRFDELREQFGERVVSAEPQAVTISTKFNLPASFEILSKPRRCQGCRKYFIPVTPNQKRHNTDTCRRAARRAVHDANKKRRR